MKFLPNGKVIFDDVYEMYYYMFNTIGLSINSANQHLYDQDTQIELRFNDKYIKATVLPIPIYAGRNDIVFDPSTNYNLMLNIFGYFIDKETASEDGDKIGYIAQSIEDELFVGKVGANDIKKQRLSVRTTRGDFFSNYYFNIYLAYIEMIFILSGDFVPDLSNFDIVF